MSTRSVAQEELFDKEGKTVRPLDWSRDGRYLIEGTLDSLSEIWVLPLFGDRKRFVYVKGDFATGAAKLSPNGKWLAYASGETKQFQVYVQTFPAPGRKWQISTIGGNFPVCEANPGETPVRSIRVCTDSQFRVKLTLSG